VFGLDFLDDDAPLKVLVAWPGDVAGGRLSGDEGAFEFDAEPFAELLMIGEGAPDAGSGCGDDDLFFDAVGLHRQPPGCIVVEVVAKCNLLVAHSREMDLLAADSDDGNAASERIEGC